MWATEVHLEKKGGERDVIYSSDYWGKEMVSNSIAFSVCAKHGLSRFPGEIGMDH